MPDTAPLPAVPRTGPTTAARAASVHPSTRQAVASHARSLCRLYGPLTTTTTTARLRHAPRPRAAYNLPSDVDAVTAVARRRCSPRPGDGEPRRPNPMTSPTSSVPRPPALRRDPAAMTTSSRPVGSVACLLRGPAPRTPKRSTALSCHRTGQASPCATSCSLIPSRSGTNAPGACRHALGSG